MLVLDVWYPYPRTVDLKTESGIAIYSNWVRFMVRHFKGRVEYYEILNEPDLNRTDLLMYQAQSIMLAPLLSI
jgi:beta-glucosidase/6-phospho-beta-glucosidase/beta-galactosidase